MAFVSQAQARFMFARHPQMAKEWAGKTPSIAALPEHVKKRKRPAVPNIDKIKA